jgi:hypothetical protein
VESVAPTTAPSIASAAVEPAATLDVPVVQPPAAAGPVAAGVAADDASSVESAPVARVAAVTGSSRASPSRASAVRRGTPVAPAVAAAAPAPTANPFRLPSTDPLTPRPWPRAVLSGQGAGAFTARYGAGVESSGEAPSFYPFEPRIVDPAGEASQTP